jgi:hypothetical protein
LEYLSLLREFRKFRRRLDLVIVIFVLLMTRIIFRSRYLYDIDSVNFALGLRRFDPGVHQPHPPGYFLYIWLGRFVQCFIHDANAALVAIGIAASCGALIAIYALADNWFGRRAALFAGLIFVFSPLVWFHGIVALTYAVETFFSASIGFCCWRIYCGSASLIIPAAVTAGIAAGFRPSILLFLGPLMVISVVSAPERPGLRRMLAGAGALALTIAAWCVPMVVQSGGMDAYWQALLSLWRIAPARQTILNSPFIVSLARFVSIAGIALLCFGCAALLMFLRVRPGQSLDYRKKTFIRLWLAPGLLFFTFVFLKFVNSGYLLVISPPIFACLGQRACNWYEDLRVAKAMKMALASVFVLANSLIFLFAPVYCSYASVRRFETELETVLRSIPQVALPAETMIVGFDSHFLGYRHAGYYLPGWFTAQYPAVRLVSGTRVFVMAHGDTRLVTEFPAGFKGFVFFPLPSDDTEYRDYTTRIRALFPTQALRTVTAGGRDFVSGSVTELPVLFPEAGKVYAVDNGARANVSGVTAGRCTDGKMRGI